MLLVVDCCQGGAVYRWSKPGRTCGAENLYGCWQDFYLWGCNAFALTDYSWDGAGLTDACNIKISPFAKVLNSIFLINYALSGRTMRCNGTHKRTTRVPPAQPTTDFTVPSISGSSNTTVQRTRVPKQQNSRQETEPTYIVRFSIPARRITRRAPELERCYMNRGITGSISFASMGGHPQCGSPAHDCDYYYFHHVADFDFGQLDRYDTDRSHLRFHSPRQVQVEFLADLAELSRPWVPTVVTQAARAFGNAS